MNGLHHESRAPMGTQPWCEAAGDDPRASRSSRELGSCPPLRGSCFPGHLIFLIPPMQLSARSHLTSVNHTPQSIAWKSCPAAVPHPRHVRCTEAAHYGMERRPRLTASHMQMPWCSCTHAAHKSASSHLRHTWQRPAGAAATPHREQTPLRRHYIKLLHSAPGSGI